MGGASFWFEIMNVPEHLIIRSDGLPFAELLSDWRWLVQENCTPVMMTAFGDLFLRDQAGHIHFLDLMCGQFKEVAVSQEAFDRLCDDREQRRAYFSWILLMELRKIHGPPADGQCFSCKVPLSLGGKMEASNFSPTDIQVHYSVLGQLQQQVSLLPPGTKIRDIKIT